MFRVMFWWLVLRSNFTQLFSPRIGLMETITDYGTKGDFVQSAACVEQTWLCSFSDMSTDLLNKYHKEFIGILGHELREKQSSPSIVWGRKYQLFIQPTMSLTDWRPWQFWRITINITGKRLTEQIYFNLKKNVPDFNNARSHYSGGGPDHGKFQILSYREYIKKKNSPHFSPCCVIIRSPVVVVLWLLEPRDSLLCVECD